MLLWRRRRRSGCSPPPPSFLHPLLTASHMCVDPYIMWYTWLPSLPDNLAMIASPSRQAGTHRTKSNCNYSCNDVPKLALYPMVSQYNNYTRGAIPHSSRHDMVCCSAWPSTSISHLHIIDPVIHQGLGMMI